MLTVKSKKNQCLEKSLSIKITFQKIQIFQRNHFPENSHFSILNILYENIIIFFGRTEREKKEEDEKNYNKLSISINHEPTVHKNKSLIQNHQLFFFSGDAE